MAHSARFLTTLAIVLVLTPAFGRDRVRTYTVVLDAAPVAERVEGPVKQMKIGADAVRKMAATVAGEKKALQQRIEAEGLEIIGSVEHVLNAVFVRATPEEAARVRRMSGVTRVVRNRRFKPLLNRAGDIVRAPEARARLGGDSQAGAGLRIAVIDTGIDPLHPAFQDPSLQPPAGFPKGRPEDLPFTNNKIIAARSYVHLLNPLDPAASRPDDTTPRDRIGHGTAVAMIAAGRPVDSPVGRLVGVAPGAFLGSYKIFGSADVNDFTNDAAVIAAIDDAVIDGMDILSISFGAVAQFPYDESGLACSDDEAVLCDPVAQAAQNAVEGFGVVVVAAAGNAGAFGERVFPTQNTIATPGTAPSAITVGATLNSRQLMQRIRFGGNEAAALSGTGPELGSPLTARAVDAAQLGDAQLCGPVAAGALQGAVAVIDRGGCEPELKIEFADQAGAVAVVLVNVEGADSPETLLGVEATDIPTFMIGAADGQRLIAYLQSRSNPDVTLDPTLRERTGFATDQVAPFSSRGPSVAGFIKPEIVAPGTFIYSGAQRLDANGDGFSETGFRSYDGTSFAAPFVAGAAALVWQAHPEFTADDVKSALVNTASPVLVEDGGDAPVTSAGAGLLDIAAALDPIGTLFPTTISFGQVNGAALPLEATLEITNTAGRTATYTAAVIARTPDSAARVRVNGAASAAVRLQPGEIGTITVSLTGAIPAPGQYEGFLQVSSDAGGLRLLAPYYYAVGDGVPANAFAINGAGVVGTVNEPHPELLIFKVIDRHGQPVSNLGVGFEVTNGGGAIITSDPATDLFGVAAADVDMGPDVGFQDYLARAGGLEIPFFNAARQKPAISGVANGAGFAANRPVTPGSIVSIFGWSLAEFSGSAKRLPLTPALKHVSVSFDFPEDGLSVPGRLFFASDGQLNVQVPWEFAGRNFVVVKTRIEDSVSETIVLDLADYAPGLFEFDFRGRQLLVATHADGSVITPDNPARPGETIVVYGTGFGPLDLPQTSGSAAEGVARVRGNVRATVRTSVAGLDAAVAFAGLTPGFVGLYQANITLPANLPAGEHALTLTSNGIESNAGTLAVR